MTVRGRKDAVRTLAAGLLATAIVALAGAPAAQADYTSCAYDSGSHTVTATLTSDTFGYLRVGAGSVIESTDATGTVSSLCGLATTANTDTVVLNGAASPQCHHIVLSGGAFAPGFTDEGDGGSEIEFSYTPTGPQQFGGCIVVDGGPLPDRVTAGRTAGVAQYLNLNSGEAVADVDVTAPSGVQWNLDGNGGNDVLSAAGGAATGVATTTTRTIGGDGTDTLSGPSSRVEGGPGDDQLTAPAGGYTRITNYDAVSGVTVNLPGGTSAGGDGHGTTDTYAITGTPQLDGSPLVDHIEGSAGPDVISGAGGADVINGNDGGDNISGMGAGATVHGNAGADFLFGNSLANVLHGDDGADQLVGDDGDDELFGGAGNDTFSEGDYVGDQSHNGADVFHGGDGSDTVAYADASVTSFSQSVSRDYGVHVTFDGVADDGEYDTPSSSTLDEHDNAMPDVENAVGTSGADVLTGSDQANYLIGFKGKDTITGGGGDDTLKSNGVPSFASDGTDTGDDILDGGLGVDMIRGFGGADTVTSNDGVADDVACGAAVDSATVDTLDVVDADCETVGRSVVAPPTPVDPGTTPTPAPTPAVAPPPASTPTTTPTTTPTRKPTFTSLVTLPATSSKRCVSRRLFRIRLRKPTGDAIVSAVVTVNGKRVKTLKGSRVTSKIDLRGLPKGRVKVKIVVTLRSGAKLSGSRSYRTCVPKRKK